MEFTRETLRLYAVTDRSWVGNQTLPEQVEAALKGGVTCVQLREKEMSEEAFLAEAKEIREICHRYGVPLLINDNVQIALKSGADGVHLGQSDGDPAEARKILGEKAVIGVSARSVAQAKAAEKAGASYLGTGAVFGTSTKKDARPLDKETLKAVCGAVSIPVVAIGGIHKGNIEKLADTDIAGVALVSAIFSAPNIEEECRLLRALSEKVAAKPFTITSTAFTEGGEIPERYSAYGENRSPALILHGLDPAAVSLAVTMDDADHPLFPGYNHWVAWNLPAVTQIPEGLPRGEAVEEPFHLEQGIAYGKHEYRGPKPPLHWRHTYIFTVYALDTTLNLPADTDKNALLAAMEGHILRTATLKGQYQRPKRKK